MESALHFHAPNARSPAACIGVFDSGVGGLSVLRALRDRLPHAPLLYVGDSQHAPYGERSNEFVLDRSHRIMAHLRSEGAIGVVIACNTATAIAVKLLREAWPELPIVGVEPGLKPAIASTHRGRIGVMATPGTLASEKFRALLAAQARGATVVARPCPGLALLIEAGDLDSPALRAAIDEHAAALRAAEVDTLVLGCTHYAFVRRHIQAAMGPEVQIIDTADAVARHAASRLEGLVGHVAGGTTIPRLRTTGDAARLSTVAAAWLSFPCDVEHLADSDLPPS